MRTIKLISGIAKDNDLTKFPDSTIVNETETSEGTPVVREIYSDVLTNIYKILRLAGVTANGNEDNELDGYQLVEALRKFSNVMNDVEQQLNLTGTIFSVQLNLAILPNKYICITKAVEDYSPSLSYTFKGTGSTILPFTSPSGFKSGDTVLLIIDTAGVRAINLSKDNETASNELFTPFGTPLAYFDGNKVFYQSGGILFSDNPESYDLQGAIRLFESDGTILVYEMLLISGYVYCLTFTPATLTYKIYRFALTNLSTPTVVSFVSGGFPSGVITDDFKPNVYTDGQKLYISNSSGGSIDDYTIDIYTINLLTGALTKDGSIDIDADFEKTTNAVVKNNVLYTFAAGTLNSYSLSFGDKNALGSFPTFIGVLFNYASTIYYSNGEVAKKWAI